jgi:hypothetical protein
MLAAFAKLLGLPARLAEDALHSERAARAVLTRRNLFAAAGAMAAGSVFVEKWVDPRVAFNASPRPNYLAYGFDHLLDKDLLIPEGGPSVFNGGDKHLNVAIESAFKVGALALLEKMKNKDPSLFARPRLVSSQPARNWCTTLDIATRRRRMT